MHESRPTIYLVRHAESAWNLERRVQGTCLDVPLSPTGERQAALLGARLRAMRLAAVYSSDAARALETARLALGGKYPLRVSSDLRELSLGEWEGRLIDDIRADAPEMLDLWYRAPSTVRISGAEDLDTFRRRVVAAIDSLAEETDGGDIAVITHGGVICAYLTHILGMRVDDLWSFSLPNASLTAVVLDFKRRLRSFGDTAHLDAPVRGLDGMPEPL